MALWSSDCSSVWFHIIKYIQFAFVQFAFGAVNDTKFRSEGIERFWVQVQLRSSCVYCVGFVQVCCYSPKTCTLG